PSNKIYESPNIPHSNAGGLDKSPISRSAWYMILPLIDIRLCLLIGLAGGRLPFGFWDYFFGSIMLSPIIGVSCLPPQGDSVLLCARLMSGSVGSSGGGGLEGPPGSERLRPEAHPDGWWQRKDVNVGMVLV